MCVRYEVCVITRDQHDWSEMTTLMAVAPMMPTTTHDGQFMIIQALWHLCQMSKNLFIFYVKDVFSSTMEATAIKFCKDYKTEKCY